MVSQTSIDSTPESQPAGWPDPMPSKEDIRKHGFYYYAVSEQERIFYEMAPEAKGLSQEIALLRSKIACAVVARTLNMNMLIRAIDSLRGVMRLHYSIIKKEQGDDVSQMMGAFIDSLDLPPDAQSALKQRPG